MPSRGAVCPLLKSPCRPPFHFFDRNRSRIQKRSLGDTAVDSFLTTQGWPNIAPAARRFSRQTSTGANAVRQQSSGRMSLDNSESSLVERRQRRVDPHSAPGVIPTPRANTRAKFLALIAARVASASTDKSSWRYSAIQAFKLRETDRDSTGCPSRGRGP
jgi:hypothetical protein